jgi:hypothetical protein
LPTNKKGATLMKNLRRIILYSCVVFFTVCSPEQQQLTQNEETNRGDRESSEDSTELISNVKQGELSENKFNRLLEVLNEYPAGIINNMTEDEFNLLIEEILVKEFGIPEEEAPLLSEELAVYLVSSNFSNIIPNSYSLSGGEKQINKYKGFSDESIDNSDDYSGFSFENGVEMGTSTTEKYSGDAEIDRDLDNDGN